MNPKFLFGGLFLLFYPPSIYFMMKEKVVPQKEAIADIPRDGLRKSCGNGVDVPSSMPCPASSESTISQTVSRYLSNSSTTENLSIYADKGAKNPSLIFDDKALAHFPRGLNSDVILSDGKKVIENGKWVGDSAGIAGPTGPSGVDSVYRLKKTLDGRQLEFPVSFLNIYCEKDSIVIGGSCNITFDTQVPLTGSSSFSGPEGVGWTCNWKAEKNKLLLSGEVVCLRK